MSPLKEYIFLDENNEGAITRQLPRLQLLQLLHLMYHVLVLESSSEYIGKVELLYMEF